MELCILNILARRKRPSMPPHFRVPWCMEMVVDSGLEMMVDSGSEMVKMEAG